MTYDPNRMRNLAEAREDENWRFRGFLKFQCDLQEREIDRHVLETTQRVWAGIDCTACANCCRQVQPSFSAEEVERLARRLRMDRQRFLETYLKPTEALSDNPWRTRTTPFPS